MTAPGNTGLNKKAFEGYVESIENIDDQKDEIRAAAKAQMEPLAAELKDIYEVAKGAGVDVKELKKLIRHRKAKRKMDAEHTDTLAMYEQVMGMLD